MNCTALSAAEQSHPEPDTFSHSSDKLQQRNSVCKDKNITPVACKSPKNCLVEVVRMFQSSKEFRSHSLVRDCLSVEGRPPANGQRKTLFAPVTVTLTRTWPKDSKDVRVYQNELSSSRFSKVRASQTDRRNWKHYHATFACGLLIIKHMCASTDLIFSLSHSIQLVQRGTVVECRSLAGERSLSCAQLASDEWPFILVNRPLQVSQLGQLSLSSFRRR